MLLLLILASTIFTLIDRSDPLDSEEFISAVEKLEKDTIRSSSFDSLKIGWSKVSITPKRVLPLAGYGARESKLFTAIHDSIFVRTFVFENPSNIYAIVNLDLLIVPPLVIKSLRKKLPAPFNIDNIYFTATHTHSSIGSWQPGFVGELFAGSFDSTVVEMISDNILSALLASRKNLAHANVGFMKVDNSDIIRNRLVGEKGTVDPWLRILKIERSDGKVGLFCTYAAHATCLSHHFNDLSADYPGAIANNLEQDSTIDFVMFTAGAVGSMSIDAPGKSGYEIINYVSDHFTTQTNLLSNIIKCEHVKDIGMFNMPVNLGEPQVRISEYLSLRPWVFNQLFRPEGSLEIRSLLIGNNLLIGMPGDFSGELVHQLDSVAEYHNINLIITSFNGNYAGYFTRDEWYDLPKYETRTMNWYGPGNGKVLTQLTEKIIEKYAHHKADTTAQ